MATFAFARYHRTQLREHNAVLFRAAPGSPAELNQIRDELSRLDVTHAELARELDGRMAYLRELEGEQFYISIDTKRRKLELRLGRDVVRDADVQIGEPRTIQRNGKTWTFVALKGGFNVAGKEMNYAWRVPEWLDPARPIVPDGLGKYVIFLPNGYVIHSPPSAGSPLQGVKPGSFLVPEADLAAIWPRITKQTRVYIF